jgi:Fic family protein
MKYEKIIQKKQLLDSFRPLPFELVKNLDDWFTVELTYTSNAIEGNTLTRRETAVVIEKGLTVGGKSLKEHLEATNHAHALDYVRSMAHKKPEEISVKDIFSIHELILKGIDNENAGCYRNVAVRISGSTVILPNARKVADLMEAFNEWLRTANDMHPVALASEAHYRLVSIHPFIDGNGRTARLLMNLILIMCGYPPAIIRKRDRLAYIGALEKAQLGGSKEPYEKIIIDAVNRSLNIYLNAVQGELSQGDLDTDALLKIGALAKASNVTIATIRYWTKEGLLEVAETSEANYQLYAPDMIDRCQKIKELKVKRLTIEEIKKTIDR